MKTRLALLAVALAVSTGAVEAAAAVHSFRYTGRGHNYVNVQTGELREVWKGHANRLGRITAHVAGWIQRPTPSTLSVHASMVIVDSRGDALIAACSGGGVLPNPNGFEDWTCDATGGVGRFARARGTWRLHIVISRVSIANGVQKNRFTERGAGRLSWNSR